jgi:hypothetical protein
MAALFEVQACRHILMLILLGVAHLVIMGGIHNKKFIRDFLEEIFVFACLLFCPFSITIPISNIFARFHVYPTRTHHQIWIKVWILIRNMITIDDHNKC